MTTPLFELRGEFITLDALLKAVGWADSGGQAKHWITEGQVSVDGQIERRRSCKIRAGQQVSCAGQTVTVSPAEHA